MGPCSYGSYIKIQTFMLLDNKGVFLLFILIIFSQTFVFIGDIFCNIS